MQCVGSESYGLVLFRAVFGGVENMYSGLGFHHGVINQAFNQLINQSWRSSFLMHSGSEVQQDS